MKKLKLLMTTTFYPPYHIGGDANHVKYLAEELARQGHEVHVMSSLDAYEIKRGKVGKLQIKPGQVYLHPLRSPRGRLEPLLVYLRGRSGYFAREFDRLVKEISPDVVHHHNISLLGYDLLKKRGSYLNVYTAHDYWLICQRNDLLKNGRCVCLDNHSCAFCVLRYHRPPQLWRHGSALREAIKDIDLAIAPSKCVSSILASATGMPFITLPNFIPPPPEDIPTAEFRDYFLYLGRLEQDKGVTELVEVFQNNWREIAAQLVVVGTGSLERRLRLDVDKRGLGDIIHVLGWCERGRVDSLLSHADALVIPSLWPENCPLVALEALSRGTPVIASDMGGLPEIAGLQGEGFVYDSGHLKEALIKVRNAHLDREQIKDIYQRHFSPEKFTAHYLELVCRGIKNA